MTSGRGSWPSPASPSDSRESSELFRKVSPREVITVSIERVFAWCPWCAIQDRFGNSSAPESSHPVATGSRTGDAGIAGCNAEPEANCRPRRVMPCPGRLSGEPSDAIVRHVPNEREDR